MHAGPLLGGGIVRTAALCPTKPGPQTVRRGPGRRSSSAFVLVDQPAEDVTAADRAEMLWPPVGCIYSIASLTCTDASGITFLFLQVPASQPEDEGDDFRVKRVAGTIVAVRVRAAPGDKLTVLAHESRRRDEEDRPALTREQPCKRASNAQSVGEYQDASPRGAVDDRGKSTAPLVSALIGCLHFHAPLRCHPRADPENRAF